MYDYINRIFPAEILSKIGNDSRAFDTKKLGVIVNAEVYTPANRFVKETLFLNKNKFITKDEFERSVTSSSEINVYDFEGKYITLALVDQHIHGGYGIDFNNANEQEIRNFLRKIKQWGQGDILATFVPGKIDELNRQIEIINGIIKNPQNGEARIAGINLEGPFLSPQKAGIHPPSNLMLPTIKLNLENKRRIIYESTTN